MAPKLAWIGLGNMGRGICKNIVEKADLTSPLIIHNRTTARAEELSKKLGQDKTKVAQSIAEAVDGADIIFTCVGDDAAIKETINEALKQNVKGKLLVDCSTVHPDTTNELAKIVGEKGADFVACPVFGAPAMADAGQLICVLAGPKASVDKVKPYTTGVIGRGIVDMTDKPYGNATLLKVIGNTFILNMVEAIAQGQTLAEKSGLGVDSLHQWIQQMFPGPYTAYSTRMTEGDYHKRKEPLFAVDLALKDVGHALALAEESETKLPGMEIAKKHLQAVKEHQGASGDIASIYGASRQESGLKYENDDS